MAVVKVTHVERELMRVELAASYLISDHPVRLGGDGKGASPGELLLAGLTAATVLGVREAASRSGAPLAGVVVRAGLRSDREGADGALGAISFLGEVARRVELIGPIANEDGAALTQDLGFGETIRTGLQLDEEVAFTPGAGAAELSAWANAALRDTASRTTTLQVGERQTGEHSGWRVQATEAGPGLALVQLSGAPILVSSDGRLGAPTPHELLLASLAACTTIFVARYSRLQNIPVQGVETSARADVLFGDGLPVRRIAKATTVSGRLDRDAQTACRYFADHCAIGESLQRGIALRSETWVGEAPKVSGATLANTQLLSPDVECDGLSCCVV